MTPIRVSSVLLELLDRLASGRLKISGVEQVAERAPHET